MSKVARNSAEDALPALPELPYAKYDGNGIYFCDDHYNAPNPGEDNTYTAVLSGRLILQNVKGLKPIVPSAIGK